MKGYWALWVAPRTYLNVDPERGRFSGLEVDG